MIEAVVFDLDGVLLDSEQVWDDVREQLARERGGRWHDRAQADMMGMSSPEWSRYMHDDLGLAESPDEINAEVVRRMLERYATDLPLIDGAVEAVRRLAAAFPLAVASSSNRPLIDAVLERAGIAALFAATVSSEEVARGKPAPDVYLEAARRLGARAGAVRGGRGLDERPSRRRGRRDARDRDPEPALPAGAGGARPGRRGARLAARAHARGRARAPSRSAVSQAGQSTRPNRTQPLWPPRPIAFDSATSTSLRARLVRDVVEVALGIRVAGS